MITETVVTTVNAAGQTHIAPMGMREVDGLVLLAPFEPSSTLENLRSTGCAVINLVDDVRVFAGCLTGRRDWSLSPTRRIRGNRLTNTVVHRELEVVRIEHDEMRPRVFAQQVYAESHAPFAGFNRAQAAVIEAAVLVSRLHMLPAEKIDQEMAYLSIAIEKTAGPREQEAWGWLMARIEQFRAESD